MKTLLDKIQTIEQQAADLVEQAQEAGKKKLAQIQTSEERVVADLRTKSEKTAQAIIDSKVHAAKEEVNKIRQEQVQSVDAVHAAAESNRDNALEKAQQLFNDEYLS